MLLLNDSLQRIRQPMNAPTVVGMPTLCTLPAVVKSPRVGSASAQNPLAAGDDNQHSSRYAQPRSGFELYRPPRQASYNMDLAVNCTVIPSKWRNAWPALKRVVCEQGKSEKSVSSLQEPEQAAYHPQAVPQAGSSRFVCINPAAACPGILDSLHLVQTSSQGGHLHGSVQDRLSVSFPCRPPYNPPAAYRPGGGSGQGYGSQTTPAPSYQPGASDMQLHGAQALQAPAYQSRGDSREAQGLDSQPASATSYQTGRYDMQASKPVRAPSYRPGGAQACGPETAPAAVHPLERMPDREHQQYRSQGAPVLSASGVFCNATKSPS